MPGLLLEHLFGTPKPVVAMVHFPALPGRPLHDRDNGWDQLVDKVGRDVEVLQAAGVDGLLFCNEGDLPYQLAVGPEVPATMAAVIGSLKRDVHVPFGVNVLWDPMATLAVARATGAGFVREVLTGVYESDLGLLQPNCGDIWGYRAKIGAGDVAMFGNITPEFSSSLDRRPSSKRGVSRSPSRLDQRAPSWRAGRPREPSRCQGCRGRRPGDGQYRGAAGDRS